MVYHQRSDAVANSSLLSRTVLMLWMGAMFQHMLLKKLSSIFATAKDLFLKMSWLHAALISGFSTFCQVERVQPQTVASMIVLGGHLFRFLMESITWQMQVLLHVIRFLSHIGVFIII